MLVNIVEQFCLKRKHKPPVSDKIFNKYLDEKMSFFQMFLFFVELVFLGITGFYFLKVRNKSSSLEILEIKLNAGKRKFDKEAAQLNELKKRLDEQKVALDKQWNLLQTDQQTLEERALTIENDRKLLEQQKSEFSRQKIETEQKQLKIDKVTQSFESKWNQQRIEFEREKESFKAKVQQLNISISNHEVEKEQLKLERHKFEKSEKFLSDKFYELKRLKSEFELQRGQVLKQKEIVQKADESDKFKPEKVEKQKADNISFKQKSEAEQSRTKKQYLEDKSQKIRMVSTQSQPVKATIETVKPVPPEEVDRETPKFSPRIEQVKKEPETNSIIETNAVKETSEDKKVDDERREKSPKLIPEIICWKIDELWNIGIKFSGNMVTSSTIRVIQNNVRLKKHEINDTYWNIKSLSSLFVQWQENNEISFKQIEFNKKRSDVSLIFKLIDENLTFGRFVSYPTTGNYVVIVPEDWERIEQDSGDSILAPQLTSLERYVGHYCNFDAEKNKSLVFKKRDGTMIAIDAGKSRFFLKGNQVMDADDGAVPLFGEKLPTIIDQQSSWDDIGTIVVTEQCKDGLEWLLTPQPGKSGQDLNLFNDLEIAKSSSSHFLVNIYNQYDDLIESMDFRYVEGLKRVKVFEPPTFPGPDGHQPGYVKFYHDQMCTIDLVKNYGNWHDIIVHNNEFTVATIPPDPAYDQTEWDICDQSGRKIRIKIDMQRVWWALASETDLMERISASDKLLELSTAMLADNSNSGIRAWVPKKCHNKEISVGFSDGNRKVILCNGYDQSIFIPLEAFENYKNNHYQKEPPVLKLWLNDKSEEWVPLAEVVFPLMSCKADKCDFKTQNKNELVEHIKVSHFSNFFKKLSYEEIRSKYDRNLPVAIYQCDYCGTYILADHDTTNPTTTIIEHIEKCPEVDRESRLVVRFKQVTDIDEIREKVMHEIPAVSECILCGRYFENQDEDSLIEHLMKEHESELFSSEAHEPKSA